MTAKAKAAAMAGGAPNGGEPSAGGGTDPGKLVGQNERQGAEK
jgi:hypothetical protein